MFVPSMARSTASLWLTVVALLVAPAHAHIVTGVTSPDNMCRAPGPGPGPVVATQVCIPACASAAGACTNTATQPLARLTFLGGPFLNASALGSDYSITVGGVPCTAPSVFVDARTLACRLTRAPAPSPDAAVRIASAVQNGSVYSNISIGVTVAVWCGEGSFADATACRPCPDGADCPAGLELPTAVPGYYSVDADGWASRSIVSPAQGTAFLPCPAPLSCLGNQSCADGTTGWLCATCASGWVRKQGAACTQCASPGVVGVLTFMIVVGTVFLAAFMIRRAMTRRSKVVIVTKMLINYLQMTFSITSYVSWASAPASTRTAASLANAGSLFSLDINSMLCTFQPSYYTLFGLNMALPLLAGAIPAAFLFTLALLAHYRIPVHMLTRTHISFKRASRLTLTSMGVLWFFMHNSIGGSILRVWRCAPAAAGGYLLADPTVSCYTKQHDVVERFAAPTLLVVYGFGIPAFYTGLVWWRRKYLSSSRMLRYFGWIYDGFAVERGMWWFEAAIMLRKLVFVALPIVIGDSQMQLIGGAGVLVAVLALQLKLQPFDVPFLNNLEAFALTGNFSLFFGMLVYVTANARGDTYTQDAMGSLMIGYNACVLVAFAAALVLASRTTAMTAARVAVKLSKGERLSEDVKGTVTRKRLADFDRRGGLHLSRAERALRHARVVTAFNLLQRQQRKVLTLATPRHLGRRGAVNSTELPPPLAAAPGLLPQLTTPGNISSPASRNGSRRASLRSQRPELHPGTSMRSFVSHGGSVAGTYAATSIMSPARRGSMSGGSEWLFDGSDSDEEEVDEARLLRRAQRAPPHRESHAPIDARGHVSGIDVDLTDTQDAASAHTAGTTPTGHMHDVGTTRGPRTVLRTRHDSKSRLTSLLPTWLRSLGASPASTSSDTHSSETATPREHPSAAAAPRAPLLRMSSSGHFDAPTPRSSLMVRRTSEPMIGSRAVSARSSVVAQLSDVGSSSDVAAASALAARVSTRRLSLQVGLPVIDEAAEAAASPSATADDSSVVRTNRVIGMQRSTSAHALQLLRTSASRGGFLPEVRPSSSRRFSAVDAPRHALPQGRGLTMLREAAESNGSIGSVPSDTAEAALVNVLLPHKRRTLAAAQSVRRLSHAVASLPDGSGFAAFAQTVEHVDVFNEDAHHAFTDLEDEDEDGDVDERKQGSVGYGANYDSSRSMFTDETEMRSWSRRSSVEDENTQSMRRALTASCASAAALPHRPLATIPRELLRNSTSSDSAAVTARSSMDGAAAGGARHDEVQSWRGDVENAATGNGGGRSWWGNALAWMKARVQPSDAAGSRRSRILSSDNSDAADVKGLMPSSPSARRVLHVTNPMTASRVTRRGSVLEQVMTSSTSSESASAAPDTRVFVNPVAAASVSASRDHSMRSWGRSSVEDDARVTFAARTTTRRMLAPAVLMESLRSALQRKG